MLADFEAEKAMLGCVIIGGLTDAVRDIKPEHLAHPAYSEAWRSVCAIDGRKVPVEPLAVAEDMKVRGRLEELAALGGLAGLVDLGNLPAYNLPSYAATVRDRAQRRAVIAASQQAATRVHDLNLRPAQVALDASATLAQLGAATSATVTTFRDAVHDFLDRMHAIRAGTHHQFLNTGVDIWDEVLGGLERGKLILLGAYPSVGKGAVIGRMCLNLAQRGVASHLQSLEDPKIWLAKRYVAGASGVPVRRLMQADRLPEHYENAVEQAVMQCDGWADRIIFDDRSRLTDDQIAAAIRQSVVQHGAQVAFIDNASEVDLEHAGDRFDLRTGRMVRLFRDVAKDLDIPIVLAVHFKRPKGGVTKEPRFIRPTSDLFKNSGAFEEAARVAVALWLNEEDPKSEVIGTVIKQTEGEKDFDFTMRMVLHAGLVDNKGGRKRDGETGYGQGVEAA